MARKFEVVSKFKNDNPTIPTRKTKESAGYDLEALGSYKIGPGAVVVISTGLKACMNPGEVLKLYIRSSIAIKRKLLLVNSVGIIDADYYNNPDNEGEIFFQFINLSPVAIELAKGDTIGQGIIKPYLKTSDDSACGERLGGFGSTSV